MVKTNMPGVLYVDGAKTAKLASGATKLPSSYIFGNYSFKLVGPQNATKTAKAAVDGNTTVDLTLEVQALPPLVPPAQAMQARQAPLPVHPVPQLIQVQDQAGQPREPRMTCGAATKMMSLAMTSMMSLKTMTRFKTSPTISITWMMNSTP